MVDFDREELHICANYLRDYADYRRALLEGLVYMFDYFKNGSEPLNLTQTACSYIRFKKFSDNTLGYSRRGAGPSNPRKSAIKSQLNDRYFRDSGLNQLQFDEIFGNIYYRCSIDRSPM